jgi:hypothetical protein
MTKFDWAEPGDPPPVLEYITVMAGPGTKRPTAEPWFSRYRHLAVSPLPRRKACPTGKLQRWQEVELVRLWRENLKRQSIARSV